MRRKLFFSLVATILIDQISKYFAHDVVLNTGISFGFFSGYVLTLGLVVILVVIGIQFGRQFVNVSPIVSGIFFGGSVSNIIDRIFFGGVRDFLPVPILNVRNNIADWAIILALLWLFFHLQKSSRSNEV